MSNILIYTTNYCPYCVKAKMLLNSKKASFKEVMVNSDELREEMIAKSNGARSVPQIFINDQHIGGCDDLYALNDKDKLDVLLNN